MFYFRKTCAIFEKCSILEKRVRSLWCFVTECFWHCLLIKKKWTGLDSFKTTAQTSGREFRRTRITIPKEVIKYRIRAAFTLMFYTEKAELWKLLFFLFGFFFYSTRNSRLLVFIFFSLQSRSLTFQHLHHHDRISYSAQCVAGRPHEVQNGNEPECLDPTLSRSCAYRDQMFSLTANPVL